MYDSLNSSSCFFAMDDALFFRSGTDSPSAPAAPNGFTPPNNDTAPAGFFLPTAAGEDFFCEDASMSEGSDLLVLDLGAEKRSSSSLSSNSPAVAFLAGLLASLGDGCFSVSVVCGAGLALVAAVGLEVEPPENGSSSPSDFLASGELPKRGSGSLFWALPTAWGFALGCSFAAITFAVVVEGAVFVEDVEAPLKGSLKSSPSSSSENTVLGLLDLLGLEAAVLGLDRAPLEKRSSSSESVVCVGAACGFGLELVVLGVIFDREPLEKRSSSSSESMVCVGVA